MTSTPVSLLERLKQPTGSSGAWEQFVQLYSPLLHEWACKDGLAPADADDLVQEVLLILLQKLPDGRYDRSQGKFRPWLRLVQRNKFIDQCRRKGLPLAPLHEDAASIPVDTSLEEEEKRAYRRALLSRALVLIKPEFTETSWNVFEELLNADGEAPAAEMAAQKYALSVGAVYTIHYRVRKRLAEELKDLLD